MKITPPQNGLCVGKTDLFFQPPSRTKEILEKQREAMNLCQQCPQMNRCREYALHYEQYGIWGGMTERQRRALRRELGIVLQTHQPGSTPGGFVC